MGLVDDTTAIAKEFLLQLNQEYATLHTAYEELFWVSYMGDHSKDDDFTAARNALDSFRNDKSYIQKIDKLTEATSDPKTSERLQHWKYFFSLYDVPAELDPLKQKIDKLESDIQQRMSKHNTGYIDPKSSSFVQATHSAMRMRMQTSSDETLRKALFDGSTASACDFAKEYIDLVQWRNEYARKAGYKNFYDYKAQTEDRMSCDEIFSVFDGLTSKLKDVHDKMREEEKSMPGLRQPWNFGYMMSGDFIKEENEYFPLQSMIDVWGRSFAALGIDYRGSKMKLDLLERNGKYNNGFCHAPIVIHYDKNGKRVAGQTNFTCTAIPGEVGSGFSAGNCLFHEGGHAAHFSNSDQQDVILNTEYQPQSSSWAETHSMFLDTMFDSIEWKTRYAANLDGSLYPFALHKKITLKTHKIKARQMLHIAAVVKFEQLVYEMDKNLTLDAIVKIASDVSLEYFDYTTPSLWLLTVPHIYSRSSACSYHGYGMADLAVAQWRDYFYQKYGYIVDNPHVGEEMTKVWKLGSSLDPQSMRIQAFGSKLSPDAYLADILMDEEELLALHQQRIDRLASVPQYTKPVDLNGPISLRDGKQKIADSDESFETMSEKRKDFINDRLSSK